MNNRKNCLIYFSATGVSSVAELKNMARKMTEFVPLKKLHPGLDSSSTKGLLDAEISNAEL